MMDLLIDKPVKKIGVAQARLEVDFCKSRILIVTFMCEFLTQGVEMRQLSIYFTQ